MLYVLTKPIVIYPVLAIVLAYIFYRLAPRYAWISIIVAVVIDLIVYWGEFTYYEALPLMIFFTVMQVIFMGFCLFCFKVYEEKKKK